MKQSKIWKIIFFVILTVLGLVLFYSWPLKLTGGNVVGVDSNGNGVWDDVEERIVKKYGYSENIQSAMFQMAIAIQRSVADDNITVASAVEIDTEVMRATECISIVDQQDETEYLDIESWVVNTENKSRRYIHYNALLSGQMNGFGDNKKYCNFEIEQ